MKRFPLKKLLPWIVFISLALGMYFGYRMTIKLQHDDNQILFPAVD